MKTYELVESSAVLQRLIGPELPICLAVKLKNISLASTPVLEAYDERYKALLEKYTKKEEREGGKTAYKVNPDMEAEAESALKELQEAEIEMEFKKIPLSELSESGVKITVPEAALLSWLIDENG